MPVRTRFRHRTGRPAAYLTTLLAALSTLLTFVLPAQQATAADATTPCTRTADAVVGYNRGALDTADAVDCLKLPFPAGAAIVVVDDRLGGSWGVAPAIVDSTGAQICGPSNTRSGTCRLGGTAPHYAKLWSVSANAPTPTPYALFLQRVDEPADGKGICPVLPAGDFTAATAASRFSTANGTFAACADIPAGDHSLKELVQIHKVSGGTDSLARFWVVEDTGRPICEVADQRNGWAACELVAGRSYRVVAAGHVASGEFDLVRRDVTATAKGCVTTPATAVGAPAATGTLPAPGTPVCRQVTTTDTRDVLYVNERDGFNEARHTVYGPAGQLSCNTTYEDCGVTGATRYQVVVTPGWNSVHAGQPYRLDAMRIAGAAGPAPECARPANISYGYGPITGVLDEQHTAVCAGLETYQHDRYDAVVKDTDRDGRGAVLSLYDGSLDRCTDRDIEIDCYLGDPVTGQPKPTVMVLGLREWNSRSAYSAELVCTVQVCGADPIAFRDVSHRTAASGTKPHVVLSGTALRAEHRLRIEHPSGARIESTTVSVDVTRENLVAALDLTGAPVGVWALSVVNEAAFDDKVTPLGTFTVTSAATNGLGVFHAMPPTRLMNTMAGLGVAQGKVGGGKTVTLQVTGKSGIPAAGVSAVVMNVTAVAPTATGYVSVFPAGTTRPATSNLNFTAGRTIPNLVVVPVSADGKVSFYNHSGSVDLLADVSGYYVTDGSGATYKPVGPTRVLNTMAGLGAPKAKLAGGQTVTLQVTGTAGIPADSVKAVAMNVTAVAPTATGYVSVFPAGTARPATSNLNFTAGTTIPNMVIVPVSADGKVSFYNHSGSVDLLADVAGYFTTDGSGSAFKPMTPTRVMNTSVGPGKTVTLPIAGTSGIPATGVTAVVMNVTAVAPTATGYVSVFPDGAPRPATSNLNFTAGTTIPNLVVVPVVNGKVSFYNHAGTVGLLADVAGYYVS
ncbi:hypothetical protein ACFY7C_29110 [Streptomyces sp. NPDC012769]|uniref:hypothetical protein n=1 Tax=Streptomyces sp. NPDC012769 TaxID=3364848 RepID=UPI0036BCAF17